MAVVFSLIKAVRKSTVDAEEPQAGGREFTETVAGLKFEVTLDKESYSSNDTINIEVTVTNVTDQTIVYVTPTSSKDYFYIRALIPAPQYDTILIYLPSEGENGYFDDAEGVHELAPAQSLASNFTFLPKVNVNGKALAVSSGEYTVHISMSLANGSYVGITVPAVINGKEQITMEQAQSIAEEHQDIQEWLADHSPEAITKQLNDQYYILQDHEWQQVDQLTGYDFYKVIVEYQEGYWIVVYQSKFGNEPHKIEVKVDLVTGEIKSVHSFER